MIQTAVKCRNMIGFVIIPVLVIAIIQLIINVCTTFLIKESFTESYKAIALIVFIVIALSFPVIGFYNSIYEAITSETVKQNAIVMSFETDSLIFWIVNTISMISVQIAFNTFLLKRIVLKNKSESV